jgi:two-component system, chemotaxis family, chemotaxis protein CheY
MSLNVLVVDDSPVMRRMVRRSLGMSGLSVGEVHEAGNGLEALTVLGKNAVDVVIADINMPEMDGVEMVERMAADRALSHLPVVMVSSDRSEGKIERLKALGVRAYLTKPFRPETFKEVVEELVPEDPPIKTEPTKGLLADLASNALEECAFVMAKPTDDAFGWSEDVVYATIGFDGPRDGDLVIAAHHDMGAELAASMLGVDPDDPDVEESVASALAEVANILCGVVVAQIFGSDAPCRLGLPEVGHGGSTPAAGVSVTLVDDERRPIFVSLALRRPARRERGFA